MPIKKGTRYLFFFAFFMLTHFWAIGQPPKPNWVDNLGGTARSAVATSLALDNENNVYVTGEFEGTVDFDPSTGVKNLTSAGGYDIFVGKYTQGGTLIWVESIGGAGNEVPNGLAVDKDGNVSIIGYFTSTTLNVNPGGGVYNLNDPTGSPDPFIIHLNTSGGFLWANAFQLTEASGEDGGYRVATDSQDDVIATYSFSSALTIGDSTYAATAGSDGLVVKYGPTGNVLWNLCLKGQSQPDVVAWGAAVDSRDNIIISGSIDSTVNFNPLGAAYTLTAANDTYASFVAKYSPAGALTWVNGINSNSEDLFIQSAVSIDPQNNVYFSTPFDNSVFLGPVTLYDPSNYGPNICIAKYSSAGALQFAKQIGGPGNLNYGTVMANDKAGNTYLTGYFNGTVNFNTNSVNTENISAHGPLDFYLAKYDPNGNYVYAFNGGSPDCGNTFAQGVAIDSDNNVDVAGAFCSTVNFAAGGCVPDSVTATSMGGSDIFIAQYASVAVTNNIITAPAVSIFCVSGAPAAITGSSPAGGTGTYTYQWQSSGDSTNFVAITGATGQNYTPPTLLVTTYFQRIAMAANCALPSVSNSILLTVVPAPPVPVVAGLTTCTGNTATLSVTSPQQGLTYTWYTSATADSSIFTGLSYTTPALDATTSYYVSSTNSTGCISVTRDSVTVTILQPLAAPVVTDGPNTASTIVFEWAAVPGATGYQVSFDNGQSYSPVSGLADTVSGLQAGQTVTILVQATGVVACQLSPASVAVTGLAISPTDDIIYVANVFTPNGDGTNDIVHVHGINIKSVRFYIYDQWGELIFSSTNTANGWDGTYRGAREPVGVYVYMVEAVMNDGSTVNKKGTVTLIR